MFSEKSFLVRIMSEIQLFLLLMILLIIFYVSLRSSNQVKEFVINSFLKLKLEAERTNIYVKGRVFTQCMYLLLNIPVNRIEDYDEIESIDEAAEKLDRSLEGNQRVGVRISAEEEFIGHCSNLQAWAENGYDTRILHRNLAFPLLKRLTEVGDPTAKKVFKEEIALRFASRHPTVTQFLIQNGYLKYLSADEFESILDDVSPTILKDITTGIKYIFEQTQNTDIQTQINYFINELLRNFGIEHVSLITSKILKKISQNHREILVKSVYTLLKTRGKFPLIQFLNQHFEYFEGFEFEYDFIKYKGKIIGIYSTNKVYLGNQNISNIAQIEVLNGKSEEIEELDLSDNDIIDLKGIEKFSHVKFLKINNNQILKLYGLENLKNLQKLFLRNNMISEMEDLENLVNLTYLDLSENQNISEIPEVLNKLPALDTVRLWNCNIKKFSESTEKFFWTNQNYRYYTDYTQRDRDYYESKLNRLASSSNKLYKHFVQWVIKMRNLMANQKFNYQDINRFETETSNSAIWSGKATNDFKKWLCDKSQTKITAFF